MNKTYQELLDELQLVRADLAMAKAHIKRLRAVGDMLAADPEDAPDYDHACSRWEAVKKETPVEVDQ